MSRIIFGYRPDGEDSLKAEERPVDLPFHWELSREEIAGRALAKRFVEGRGLVARLGPYALGGAR